VALWQKETCNLMHPMGLRHPVVSFCAKCYFTVGLTCIYSSTCSVNFPVANICSSLMWHDSPIHKQCVTITLVNELEVLLTWLVSALDLFAKWRGSSICDVAHPYVTWLIHARTAHDHREAFLFDLFDRIICDMTHFCSRLICSRERRGS